MVSTSSNDQSAVRKELFESKLAYSNSTLPFLEAVVSEIEQLSLEHRSIKSRLAAIKHHRPPQSPGDLYSEELEAVETSADELADRIARCYDELRQVAGLSVDDKRRSFVDFPTETDLGQIAFCWKLGEGKVCHRHWADEACESRRPLAELTELAEIESSSLLA